MRVTWTVIDGKFLACGVDDDVSKGASTPLQRSNRERWADQTSSFSVCDNKCISGGFICGDQKCINFGRICDGKDDCLDGEDDEIMCSITSTSTIDPPTTTEIHEKLMIHGTNCSSNETYCEPDGKCILISNVSNCVGADVQNNVSYFPVPRNLDPLPLKAPAFVIAIVVITMIGICVAVFTRRHKKNKMSARSISNIPLQPILPELQTLHPLSPPIIHLTPPWKSNPSLICLFVLGEGSFGKVYKFEDKVAIGRSTGYAIKCIDMAKTLRSCSGPSGISSTKSAISTRNTSLQNSMNILLNEMQIMDQLSSDHVVRYYGCWAEAEDCTQLVLTQSRLEEYINELIADSNNSMTSTQSSPLSHIFIRMELCHTTLKHYLQAYPEHGEDEISIVQQVATGLLYVHTVFVHEKLVMGDFV
ncbi:putative serine/threonine-protein kinase GCN2 [Folsomia candida]|uniref:Putative serine/threonine-protein kinase GCN2 n=1 Tax=Folsomia candida TaxID=158441 RepID=A0A226F3H4_FOLCA|nr:putative serine/threonine-protein kinase GCN2 [Folsomia candida]